MPTTASPRTRFHRFQFRLRTLLLFVTLAAVFCGAALWWVTLPQRTWRQFVARVQAGDIEGANLLCDPRSARIVSQSEVIESLYAFRPEPVNMVECTSLSKFIEQVQPLPRTCADLILGRIEIDTSQAEGGVGQTDIEIVRDKVHVTQGAVQFTAGR
jgi:hypothetical protein